MKKKKSFRGLKEIGLLAMLIGIYQFLMFFYQYQIFPDIEFNKFNYYSNGLVFLIGMISYMLGFISELKEEQ